MLGVCVVLLTFCCGGVVVYAWVIGVLCYLVTLCCVVCMGGVVCDELLFSILYFGWFLGYRLIGVVGLRWCGVLLI